MSNRQLLSLVKELHRGLSTEVYDAQAMRIIEISRKVLDVTSLGVKLKDISFIKLSLEFPNIKQAITDILISDLKSIPEDVLRHQHKRFMQRVECVTKKFSIKQLKDMDPKEILKLFFNTQMKLYHDIEMIMHAISCMMVIQACELVLESLVSQYENHFDVRRNVNEETANQEFNIAVNGPNLSHTDVVLKQAMDNYWKAKNSPWHFVRSSTIELHHTTEPSTVLKRMIGTKSILPFME